MKKIKLNKIENYIELKNKRRIQSKKLQNVLNYFESELVNDKAFRRKIINFYIQPDRYSLNFTIDSVTIFIPGCDD